MRGRVAVDHRAEAGLCATDGSVHEGELRDVVFVDHSQYGALGDPVHGRVPYLILVGSQELSL